MLAIAGTPATSAIGRPKAKEGMPTTPGTSAIAGRLATLIALEAKVTPATAGMQPAASDYA
jgi:hypothetical protein